MTDYIELEVDLGETITVTIEDGEALETADTRVTSDGDTRVLSDGEDRLVTGTEITTEVLEVDLQEVINVVLE